MICSAIVPTPDQSGSYRRHQLDGHQHVPVQLVPLGPGGQHPRVSTHVPGVITGGHAVFHASAATAPAGGLDSGVPVPERTRLSRDTAGDIVRATLDVYPADRFVVTYDLDPPGI